MSAIIWASMKRWGVAVSDHHCPSEPARAMRMRWIRLDGLRPWRHFDFSNQMSTVATPASGWSSWCLQSQQPGAVFTSLLSPGAEILQFQSCAELLPWHEGTYVIHVPMSTCLSASWEEMAWMNLETLLRWNQFPDWFSHCQQKAVQTSTLFAGMEEGRKGYF